MVIVKKVMAGLVLCFLVFFVWWAGMNYTGYCHIQSHYLTDDEFLVSAITKSVRTLNSGESTNSARDFLYENRECCILTTRYKESGSFFNKALGLGHFEISMNVDIQQKTSETIKTGKYKQYIRLDSCGDELERYGELIDD